MKLREASSPQEYLRNVITQWKAFKNSNGGLVKAIEAVLDENERLKKQIAKMRGGRNMRKVVYIAWKGLKGFFNNALEAITEPFVSLAVGLDESRRINEGGSWDKYWSKRNKKER